MEELSEHIAGWAAKLPYWERRALAWIIEDHVLGEDEYQKLLQWLLEDSGLAKARGKREPVALPAAPPAAAGGRVRRLVRLFELENVNALAESQQLTFSPQLTVVYGESASGKSGYARVLACLGSSKGRRDILSNVHSDDGGSWSAKLEVADDETQWVMECSDEPKAELAGFYIFDSVGAEVHLTRANAITVEPAGLSGLRMLAEVTDHVRARLRELIASKATDEALGNVFAEDTEVGRLVAQVEASLGNEELLQELEGLAKRGEKEGDLAKDLERFIASLQSTDAGAARARLELNKKDLENLRAQLELADEELGNDVERDIRGLIATVNAASEEARAVSVEEFKVEYFREIGSPVWQEFVEVAKRLGEAESEGREAYPQNGDRCLLCRQVLADEAITLLRRLSEFLGSQARERAKELEASLAEKLMQLQAVMMPPFDESVSVRRLVEGEDDALAVAVGEFIDGCRQRRASLASAIESRSEPSKLPVPSRPVGRLDSLIREHGAQIEALSNEAAGDELDSLRRQLREVNDRRTLVDRIAAIREAAQRREWARKAASAGGSTQHITLKYDELFGELVTEEYIAAFRTILAELGQPIDVRVETFGRKGSSRKQLVLSNIASSKPAVPITKVLSEGEQQAVALADFLAEVAVDQEAAGVVLDDPVNSLGAQWKAAFAAVLAQHASQHQVIVFTHDLHFAYLLDREAEKRGISPANHSVRKGSEHQPGHVLLDNSPSAEQNYKNAAIARGYHSRALKCELDQQDDLLKLGYAALRTSYEAFIMFNIFEQVVMRFEERVSCGRLREIVWDDSVVDEVIEGYGRLSRVIEGHLPVGGSRAAPTPSGLLKEIEHLDSLRDRLRKLKKAKKRGR